MKELVAARYFSFLTEKRFIISVTSDLRRLFCFTGLIHSLVVFHAQADEATGKNPLTYQSQHFDYLLEDGSLFYPVIGLPEFNLAGKVFVPKLNLLSYTNESDRNLWELNFLQPSAYLSSEKYLVVHTPWGSKMTLSKIGAKSFSNKLWVAFEFESADESIIVSPKDIKGLSDIKGRPMSR